jgi:hypothetical protein
MGFFKKIGTAIKKGVKQVSLKNIVKIGTPLLGAIPVFGGLAQNVVSNLSDAHAMKKQAEAELQAGNVERANALAQQAEILANQQGQTVATVANTNLNAFAKGATDKLLSNVPVVYSQTAGIVGATVVDSSIKEWFKMHWQMLTVGLVAIGGVIYFFKNRTPAKKTYKKY